MASDPPSIGIICQTLVQQHHLRQVVEELGLALEKNLLVSSVLAKPVILDKCAGVDIWLVEIDMEELADESGCEDFEEWLYTVDCPVIFGDGINRNTVDGGLQSWSRQLRAKLVETTAKLLQSGTGNDRPAQFIWVLAASAGGPEAVKAFLDNLPTGLGIGFLYVQHIEQRQHQPLIESITRDSAYDSRIATHGACISADTVTLVPVSDVIHVLGSGIVVSGEGESWRGDYNPSIDQVVANIADVGRDLAGVIFFSGMGDDGVAGARLMAKNGGRVWAQTPASCRADSMPRAIHETGLVSASGGPTQLAAKLTSIYTVKMNGKGTSRYAKPEANKQAGSVRVGRNAAGH